MPTWWCNRYCKIKPTTFFCFFSTKFSFVFCFCKHTSNRHKGTYLQTKRNENRPRTRIRPHEKTTTNLNSLYNQHLRNKKQLTTIIFRKIYSFRRNATKISVSLQLFAFVARHSMLLTFNNKRWRLKQLKHDKELSLS